MHTVKSGALRSPLKPFVRKFSASQPKQTHKESVPSLSFTSSSHQSNPQNRKIWKLVGVVGGVSAGALLFSQLTEEHLAHAAEEPAPTAPAAPAAPLPSLPAPDASSVPSPTSSTDITADVSSKSGKSKRKKKDKIRNPGRLEDNERDMKALSPDPFEGGRFSMQRVIWPGQPKQFVLAGDMVMSPGGGGGFGEQGPSSSNIRTQLQVGHHVLMGQLDNSGGLFGRYNYKIASWLKSRLMFQTNANENNVYGRACFDIKGKDWTTTATFDNQEQLSLNYFQGVTPTIAMGAEIAHLLMQRTALHGVIKYKDAKYERVGKKEEETEGDTVIFMARSDGDVHLDYQRRLNKNFAVGTTMTCIVPAHETETSIQAVWQRMTFRMNGQLVSDGRIVGVAAKSLDMMPLQVTVSSDINPWPGKESYKFGVGVEVVLQ